MLRNIYHVQPAASEFVVACNWSNRGCRSVYKYDIAIDIKFATNNRRSFPCRHQILTGHCDFTIFFLLIRCFSNSCVWGVSHCSNITFLRQEKTKFAWKRTQSRQEVFSNINVRPTSSNCSSLCCFSFFETNSPQIWNFRWLIYLC